MSRAGRDDVFFLECGKNSTIISTVVRDDDGATDDDVTNDDDEANVGDAGGGTGGGTMRLARVATMGAGVKTRQSNRPSFATMTVQRTTT